MIHDWMAMSHFVSDAFTWVVICLYANLFDYGMHQAAFESHTSTDEEFIESESMSFLVSVSNILNSFSCSQLHIVFDELFATVKSQ